MLPVDEQQTYQGLIITRHHIVDSVSKDEAQDSVYGWEFQAHTAPAWIRALENGNTIQPSLFIPKPDGSYTHNWQSGLWQSTNFICADGDNFLGVEKDDEGNEKNPKGIPAWTGESVLKEKYPELKEDVYAVGQSVSTMQTETPHRRYRLIFLFDKPIKSVDHYKQILSTLAEKYPLISVGKRSPAQPVFGNARKNFRKFYISDPSVILSLSDYPYVQPVASETASINGNTPAGKYNATQRKYQGDLDGLISDAKLVRHETGADGKVRVDCPFNPDHKRDAFVGLDAGGYPYFSCHHNNSCSGNGFNEMVKQAGVEVVFESKAGAKVGETDSEKLNPVDIAEEFMDKENYWFTHEALHQYNKQTGLYQPCVPILRAESRTKMGRKARSNAVSEVENHITDMAHRSDFASEGVVFKNGILDLETMELSAHTPDSYHLRGFPVNYLTDSEIEVKVFRNYLYELTMDVDAVTTLLQMIGACFDGDVFEMQTAFILTGSGSNGKSTLLDIIEELIGGDNISRTPFTDYGKDRWAKAGLVDKSVALDDDIDPTLPLGPALKGLITKEMHEAEFKYLNKFRFPLEATFIGAINGQPHTSDTTSAFWRRFIPLDFPNRFKKDAGKRRALMSEFTSPEMLDTIAAQSIRQYMIAKEAGNFSIPEQSDALVAEFQENANHVITFADDRLEHSPDLYESRKEVWSAYVQWANENEVKAYGAKRFWGALRNLNFDLSRKVRVNDKSERVVYDVKLV